MKKLITYSIILGSILFIISVDVTLAQKSICPDGQITEGCTCGQKVYSNGYCCNNSPQKQPCENAEKPPINTDKPPINIEKPPIQVKPPCEGCFLKPEIKKYKKKYIAQTDEYTLSSKLALFEADNKVYFKKNNQNFVLPIQPDSAIDIAVARSKPERVKSIELEVEDGNPVYKIKSKKPFKLFGFIPASITVKTEINANTGEIIEERESWYSFLGRTQDSTLEPGSMGYSDNECRQGCIQEFRDCVNNNHGNPSGLIECNEQRGECTEECGGGSSGESHFGGSAAHRLSEEMKEAGIDITRVWIKWDSIERENDNYDWTEMDEVVRLSNNAGIEVLGYFISMPVWARDESDPSCNLGVGKMGDICSPKNWADYEEFAKKVAERYDGNHGHGKMEYIGIFNEVQLFSGVNEKLYGEFLTRGYNAIKQGNPDAQVNIASFLDPFEFSESGEFINIMFRDYSDYFDIVDFHVYRKSNGVTQTSIDIRERMQTYGINKPMWITETATNIRNISCDSLDWYNFIAVDVVKRYARAFAEGVDKVFWFGFVSSPYTTENNSGIACGQQQGNNIFNSGGLGWSLKGIATYHPRSAYEAYKTMTSRLAGFTSVEKITDTQYKFNVNGNDVYVLWCESGSCDLPSEIHGMVTVTDYLGNEETKNVNQITLSASPIFIETTGNTPPTECGNGTCDNNESCSSCSQDCGDCSVSSEEIHFGTGGGVQKFSADQKAAGIELAREWIKWRDIEPTEDNYEWADMDATVQAANNAGIEILGYPIFTPTWANKNSDCTSDICTINDMDDFREFARDVSQRYDGNHGHGEMKYIEILNEVTQPVFFEKDRDNKYEEWLIAGYEGVKVGNPNAQVLIGGFINPLGAEVFIKNMLQNYNNYYDIVNFHVYETEDQNTTATQALKQWMAEYNVDKPLWLTETATIERYDGDDSLSRIANGMIRRFIRSFGEGVDKVFYFSFIGPQNPSTGDKTFGLGWSQKGTATFHPWPAYNAYQTMTSKLSGFSSANKITDTQYKFSVNGNNVYVLWCDFGSCDLPSEIHGMVTVTDYLGNEETMNANQITLTESPIFVE